MGLQTADPRLVLKATPPKVTKALLARARLSSSNPELIDKSAIAVTAASGFGKTALLAQWRREALAMGSIVAWLTLDPWDDDNRFADGLAVAMRVGSGKARFGQTDFPLVGQRETPQERITRWLAEIIELAAEVVLILEDVHALPAATVENSLTYLLNNAPANLKIIMASRKTMNFPVAELLARGQFISLDAEALRLRPAETSAVLDARFGNRIDPDACAQLHQITEGWPLGLQLAIAKIEKSPNIRDAIAGCFVCSGDIRRFFVESLVERLSEREANFLVCVSFVDALHPGLCLAITQDDDSQTILARLCEVTPIFTEGVGSEWLRIHPLAREFLNERFETLPEAQRQLLRGNAARWLAEHKMFEEAGRHALQAGQKELAYQFAEQCLYDVLLTGQLSRVSEWIDQIPAAEMARTPRLRLALGWTLAQSERHAEAAGVVSTMLDEPSVSDDYRCESAEICATAALFADDFSVLAAQATPWFDRLAMRAPIQRQVGTNLQALIALFQGGPEHARHLYQSLPATDEQSSGYVHGWRDYVIGLSLLWQGQVALAEEHVRVALVTAEEKAGRRSPIAAMLGAILAAVLWERQEVTEIPALFADRNDVLVRHTAPDAIMLGFVSAARYAVHAGMERRGYDVLERLFALGESRHLPRLCIASLGEQIRLHALTGHASACSILHKRLEQIRPATAAGDWGMLQPLITLQMGLARAYVHVAHKQWQEVNTVLDSVRPVAEQLRRGKDRIQIQLLQALALKRCGEDGDHLFAEALSVTRHYGLERIIRDTHPDLAEWANTLSNTGNEWTVDAPRELIERPDVATTTRTRQETGQIRVAPSVLLTPKERDVLRLLARNLSNKEIAQALEVGPETVKWHLKNLFGKLDAGNRKHLLDRARNLGIIETGA